MWADNETANDLIGFKIHSDLILDVVTDPDLLPVVLGVFGDWGGGKSSIMKMLQKDLESGKYRDVVCLYFNGWMFEGYEDAKTALLSSILVGLGEHRNFAPQVRDRVVGLLKRVKWMELMKVGIKHVGIPLAAGVLTGGMGAIPAALAPFVPGIAANLFCSSEPQKSVDSEGEQSSKEEDAKGDKKEEINWTDLIKTHSGKSDLLEIRKFRRDFDDLLNETDVKSLVILIDDLDRCLPERIIETLEAIKLFAAVSKTAFVIGADPRIVRHAIATRYVKQQLRDEDTTKQEESDLVKDYLEKLIQIPYHLPRLSPAEIETYINLLLCQQSLGSEECSIILSDWARTRKTNFYASYQYGAIKEALKGRQLPGDLEGRLVWSSAIAPAVTEGLKGNPRQVKRMLNAMLLRQRLAKVANIPIRDEVLAKLMVLEYTHLRLFGELNLWQTQDNGYPQKLRALEKSARGEEEHAISDETLRDWQTETIKKWLRMHPPLSDIDLRDYFWLVRDKTGSTLSGLTMISPFVRRLLEQLISGKKGEMQIAVKEAVDLEETERDVLLQLLEEHMERHPDRKDAAEALRNLFIEHRMDSAAKKLFTAIRRSPPVHLHAGVAQRVKEIAEFDTRFREEGYQVLQELAKSSTTRVGKAAQAILEKG